MENSNEEVIDSNSNGPETSQQLSICVKTINNEIHNISVELDSLVSAFKIKVEEATTIEPDRQRLIYRGRVLQDEETIRSYNIESGHTVHMVAKPVNYRELQRQASDNSSTTRSISGSSGGAAGAQFSSLSAGGATLTGIPAFQMPSMNGALGVGGMGAANVVQPSPTVRRAILESIGRSLSGGNPIPVAAPITNPAATSAGASAAAAALNANAQQQQGENRVQLRSSQLENIRQGMLTVNTLLSMNSEYQQLYTPEIPANSNEENRLPIRRFYRGQWIDVKDTVQQWLEATVMNVDDQRCMIFVHYNGWPQRWDEWIRWDSPRIAPFRSRTAHSTLTGAACPTPNVIPPHAQRTGVADVRTVIPELVRLYQALQPMMTALAESTTDDLQQRPVTLTPTAAAAATGAATTANSANNSLNVNGIAEGMPWQQFHQPPSTFPSANSSVVNSNVYTTDNRTTDTLPSPAAVTTDEASAADSQDHLRQQYRDMVPILDRFGRVLTDFSSYLWSEVDTYQPPAPANNLFAGLGSQFAGNSFEARLLNLLRERPPSPPPMRAYQAPINGVFRADEQHPHGRTTGGSDHHVDIHIAILSPPTTGATTTAGATTAGTSTAEPTPSMTTAEPVVTRTSATAPTPAAPTATASSEAAPERATVETAEAVTTTNVNNNTSASATGSTSSSNNPNSSANGNSTSSYSYTFPASGSSGGSSAGASRSTAAPNGMDANDISAIAAAAIAQAFGGGGGGGAEGNAGSSTNNLQNILNGLNLNNMSTGTFVYDASDLFSGSGGGGIDINNIFNASMNNHMNHFSSGRPATFAAPASTPTTTTASAVPITAAAAAAAANHAATAESLSRSVADITSSLQLQAQQLARRTQELTERTSAVTEITHTLGEILRNRREQLESLQQQTQTQAQLLSQHSQQQTNTMAGTSAVSSEAADPDVPSLTDMSPPPEREPIVEEPEDEAIMESDEEEEEDRHSSGHRGGAERIEEIHSDSGHRDDDNDDLSIASSHLSTGSRNRIYHHHSHSDNEEVDDDEDDEDDEDEDEGSYYSDNSSSDSVELRQYLEDIMIREYLSGDPRYHPQLQAQINNNSAMELSLLQEQQRLLQQMQEHLELERQHRQLHGTAVSTNNSNTSDLSRHYSGTYGVLSSDDVLRILQQRVESDDDEEEEVDDDANDNNDDGNDEYCNDFEDQNEVHNRASSVIATTSTAEEAEEEEDRSAVLLQDLDEGLTQVMQRFASAGDSLMNEEPSTETNSRVGGEAAGAQLFFSEHATKANLHANQQQEYRSSQENINDVPFYNLPNSTIVENGDVSNHASAATIQASADERNNRDTGMTLDALAASALDLDTTCCTESQLPQPPQEEEDITMAGAVGTADRATRRSGPAAKDIFALAYDTSGKDNESSKSQDANSNRSDTMIDHSNTEMPFIAHDDLVETDDFVEERGDHLSSSSFSSSSAAVVTTNSTVARTMETDNTSSTIIVNSNDSSYVNGNAAVNNDMEPTTETSTAAEASTAEVPQGEPQQRRGSSSNNGLGMIQRLFSFRR